MKKPEKKETGRIVEKIVFAMIVVALIIYFRWLVNPALIYTSQSPIFFTTGSFFTEQLSQPGGIMSYLAAFAGQFFIFPWMGAVILTLLIVATTCLTLKMVKIHGLPEIPIIIMLPAIILTMALSHYSFPLSNSLGLVLSLSFYVLFQLFKNHKPVVRCCLALFFAVLSFFLTAGPFLLFIVLCLVSELSRRDFITPLLLILGAVFIPWLAAKFFYLYPAKIVYQSLLPFTANDIPRYLAWVLYLIFPCFLIWSMVRTQWLSRTKNATVNIAKKDTRKHSTILNIIQYPILVLMIVGALLISFNRSEKILLQADEDARMNQWTELINHITVQKFTNTQLIHYFYRALYHINRLPYDLFFYSYIDGAQENLFSYEIGTRSPLGYSDFFFDVGLLNESQHWAFEALTIHGPKVQVLQRLALINILKGEKLAAMKFLKKLESTLFIKNWAKRYEQYVDNPGLIDHDPILRRARTNSSDQDFITINKDPYGALESLFQRNKNNKMVFEYLSVHDLLSGRLESFMTRLPFINNYSYREIPRVFEEAVVLYMTLKKLPSFNISGKTISRNTSDRFLEFQRIYAQHNGDKNAAFNELAAKFSQSVWFYLLYRRSIPSASAEQ
jgi:hypothetical protein